MTEELNWPAPTPPTPPSDSWLSNETLAGFWIRLLAHMCDQLSSLLAVLPVALLVGAFGANDITIMSISSFAGAWLIAYWTSRRGGSPLRVKLGVLVLNKKDGSFLTLQQSLVRTMFSWLLATCSNVVWIFAIPALVDYLNTLWDKNKQTWHDKVAGSVVVKR